MSSVVLTGRIGEISPSHHFNNLYQCHYSPVDINDLAFLAAAILGPVWVWLRETSMIVGSYLCSW